MEVVIDNNITALLDGNYIYQVRQGMARIPEAVVHRWKSGERIKYEIGCSIEPFSTFASGNGLFTCGSFSSIASSLRENSIVGRYVEIAPGCSMLGVRHPIESVSTNSAIFNFARENVYPYFHKYEAANGNVKKISVPTPQPQAEPLRIGNDVWIGNNCILSGGITIHTGAVVASNSVVVKDVPPYAIVGGVPATIRKFRFPREVIDGLLEVKWWDYELGDMYREGLDFSNPEKFLSKFMSNVSNIRKYTPKIFSLALNLVNAKKLMVQS